MKGILAFLILALLASPLLSGQQRLPRRDEDAIRAIIDNFEDSYTKRDGAAWATYFAEYADFMQAFGRYIKGRPLIQEWMSQLLSSQTDMFKAHEIDRRVQMVKPDIAFAEMTEELTGVREADGTTQPPRRGHMILVIKKDGTNWKIIHYRYLDIHTDFIR